MRSRHVVPIVTVLLLASLAVTTAAQDDAGAGRITRLLAADQAVFGVFGGAQTAEQGRVMGAEPEPDFVFYSLESGPFDIPAMEAFLAAMAEGTAAAGVDTRPLVLRIPPVRDDPGAAAGRVGEAVAAGVEGIVFPHVENAEQAAAAVAAMGDEGWPANPDGRLVNMLIVEDRVGVENAGAIAATPGVGVVFAGPGDLSRAYDRDAEAVEAAIRTILAACKAHDVPCGITAGADDIEMRIEQGFEVFIAFAPDAIPIGKSAAGRTSARDTERERRRAEAERRVAEDLASERPIAAVDSIWIDELTWMEVRDAIAAGSRTAIVPTGGIEQNGPYLVTGKHNVVLRAACEDVARTLGDALCAPVLKLVPEGNIDPPSGHLLYPGTISLREETFRMVLEDVAGSLRAGGFEHIVLIGDSGGNQRGMAAVAEELSARWSDARIHYVAEFYRYPELLEYLHQDLGVPEPEPEGLHDDFAITSMMMTIDPASVRYEQRVAAGLDSINGVALRPIEGTIETGRRLLQRRVDETVAAIRAAIAASATDSP